MFLFVRMNKVKILATHKTFKADMDYNFQKN